MTEPVGTETATETPDPNGPLPQGLEVGHRERA